MNEDLNVILQKLANNTMDLPIDRVVGEVSLVIERLGFAEIDLTASSNEETLKKLNYLLNNDVSPGIHEFVLYLYNNQRLGVLLNDAGKMFPDVCKGYFLEMKQLTIRTAVRMSDKAQTDIRVLLLRRYPINTRIVFESAHEVVAGFMLYDSKGLVADVSLHSKMIKLLETYIKRKIPTP